MRTDYLLCAYFLSETSWDRRAATLCATGWRIWCRTRKIDLVIANGENSASGFGITPKIVDELLRCGVEVISGGNHSWDRREIMEFMPHEARLLRPANFPDGNPGSGMYVGTAKNGMKYAVINLQGRVFLPAIDDPFRKADELLASLLADVAFVLVDMHAETTSEKIAMGWYLDGRATAVVGTHTHVATADEHVLPGRHGVYHGRGHDRAACRGDRDGSRPRSSRNFWMDCRRDLKWRRATCR